VRRGSRRRGECYASNHSSETAAKACIQDSPLLFLHIPKTGGTTVEEAGLRQGIKWGRHMEKRGCDLGSGKCNVWWHEPPALMHAINIYTAATVFCVVRSPFARAVLEYKWMYNKPEYRGHSARLLEKHGCSAKGLNTWLKRILTEFKKGDKWQRMCHMVPQSFYIWGPPNHHGDQCQYCHEVLRLEEFPEALNRLMTRYNQSVVLSENDHMNQGGCEKLSEKNISSASADLIRDVYRHDFALLNYSTEIPP